MPRFRNIRTSIDWNGYVGDRVLLTVCHRSPAMQGRNFLSLIETLAQRVTHLHIMMCDTLDRYNDTQSQEKGSQWLEEKLPVINAAGLRYDITRWNQVMSDPSFKPRFRTMTEMYETCAETREIIHNISSFYVESNRARAEKDGRDFDLTTAKEAAARYLVEEFAGCPVYRDWFDDIPEVYWGVYINDPHVFNRLNDIAPDIDLTQPTVLPVTNNRLGCAIPGIRSYPANLAA